MNKQRKCESAHVIEIIIILKQTSLIGPIYQLTPLVGIQVHNVNYSISVGHFNKPSFLWHFIFKQYKQKEIIYNIL